jgi:hypothetical protein
MLAPSPACSLNHNSAPGGIPYPDSIRLDNALAEIEALAGYGIIVVVWPGLVTVMTPAQLHMQVETLSSAG